mmetsp:Transcript_14041/g.34764  ORF Transcript_14041/g.34764 Transcript_14041/m.34764 type:complete len:227 (+) Transcript_14041:1077-1757(+)
MWPQPKPVGRVRRVCTVSTGTSAQQPHGVCFRCTCVKSRPFGTPKNSLQISCSFLGSRASHHSHDDCLLWERDDHEFLLGLIKSEDADAVSSRSPLVVSMVMVFAWATAAPPALGGPPIKTVLSLKATRGPFSPCAPPAAPATLACTFLRAASMICWGTVFLNTFSSTPGLVPHICRVFMLKLRRTRAPFALYSCSGGLALLELPPILNLLENATSTAYNYSELLV